MPTQIASVIDMSVLGGVAFAIGIAGVGLWLAAAWWTYGDMVRRTNSDLARYGAAAWILLSTPALLLISLPVYLLTRPQATAAQRRSRDLVLALRTELFDALRCEACGEAVAEEWRRCPACATWLQVACVDCGRWSATNLELCPWCATPRIEEPDDVRLPEMAPAPVFSFVPQRPLLATAPADASPSPVLEPASGTPGPWDLRRSGRRGRGFEEAVDETPAAVGR